MKTIYEELKNFLENCPKARERKYKDEAIVFLLTHKLAYKDGVPNTELTFFVQKYASYDRAWRQVLQENEGLRGKDYAEGKVLSQEKQIELGYEPGIRVPHVVSHIRKEALGTMSLI
jgi:hypothetical protein